MDIYSPSYGQKKGRESNCQFDSRPKKVGNRPDLLGCRQCATYRWKGLDEIYNFGLDRISIRGFLAKLSGFKVAEVLTWPISRLPLGSPGTKSHLDATSMESHRVYYKGVWWWHLPSPGRGVSCESELARGLSQHQMHAK